MASELSREQQGCPDCHAYAATWITDCLNPIHAEQANFRLNKLEQENATLHQQLEQSQQLVTDGHEAIGHWQGEYEQLRQQLEAVLLDRAIANNLAESEQKKAEQLQQRVQELEQALRLHLAVAADDPILLQHDRKEPS